MKDFLKNLSQNSQTQRIIRVIMATLYLISSRNLQEAMMCLPALGQKATVVFRSPTPLRVVCVCLCVLVCVCLDLSVRMTLLKHFTL